MSLAVGSRLGAYEILAPIGHGGMGEVYRARDTKLGRDVAIKVLPEAVAASPDRIARFEREARLLATLNHPNIAQVYGLEESSGERATSGGRMALVMELVDGSDLSVLIARGRVPIAEALPIARQIAEALEAAHDAGIVHRDLKPANIKVRPNGAVKVLDFGLARAIGVDSGEGSPAPSDDSPTVTSPALSQAGIILGTAAYMAPEQARGQVADRRADIWAFGVVLFEMLSGRRLFSGETTTDLFASLLREEIDWSRLPPETPEAVRQILGRCLERDVRRRLQAIGEARLVLEEAVSSRVQAAGPASTTAPGSNSSANRESLLSSRGRRGLWLGVGGIIVAIVASAWLLWPSLRGSTSSTVSAPVSSSRSIAVLPFVNESGNSDDEYIADGITDELIAGLGKVPGLKVAARSSVFAFKSQKAEVRDIAKRLGVETILEGTLRRSGKRLRVTASLVSAGDGLQLWSQSFQNDGGDTFAVQDDVTRGVVGGLSLELGGTALAASRAGRSTDPEAQDLYLRGLSLANGTTEAELKHALQLYQQAVARDPRFALPYAGMAWVYGGLADAYMSPNEAYPKAKAAAQAAIERDELVADAHAMLAYAVSVFEWNHAAAAPEFERALQLNPNSAQALFLEGFDSCFAGRIDDGLTDLDRGSAIDPLSAIPLWAREMCLYLGHRFDQVAAAHARTMAVDPKMWYLLSWSGAAKRELGDYVGALREYQEAATLSGGAPDPGLAITYARMGRIAEAKAIARQLDEQSRQRYVPFWFRAAVRGGLGEMDTAAALFQRAIDTHESFLVGASLFPELATLGVKDPRLRQMLEHVDALQRATAPAGR